MFRSRHKGRSAAAKVATRVQTSQSSADPATTVPDCKRVLTCCAAESPSPSSPSTPSSCCSSQYAPAVSPCTHKGRASLGSRWWARASAQRSSGASVFVFSGYDPLFDDRQTALSASDYEVQELDPDITNLSTAFVGIDSFHGVTWHKNCYCTVVLMAQPSANRRLPPDEQLTPERPQQVKICGEEVMTEKAHIRSMIKEALPSEVFFVELDPRMEWNISIKIKKFGLGKMVKRELESVLVPFLTNGEVELSKGSLYLRSGWVSVQPGMRQGLNLGLQGYRYAVKQYNQKTKKWSDGYVVIQFRDAQNSRICLANTKNELHTSINLSKLHYVAACDERYLVPLQGFSCRIFYWDERPEQPVHSRLRVNFASERARLSFIERVLMHIDTTEHTMDRANLNLFVGTWNAGNAEPQANTIVPWIPLGQDMYCLTAQELVWLDERNRPRAVAAVEAPLSEEDLEALTIVGSDEDPSASKERKPNFGERMTKMRNLAKSAGTIRCGVHFNRLVAAHLGKAYVMIAAVVNYDRVICVFVHWKLLASVENTAVSSCLLAKFGNKGAVACKVRIRLQEELSTSLTFAGVHLSAGEDAGSYAVRNNNYRAICETLAFKDHRGVEFPEDSDLCFVSGDLNYRLSLQPTETRQTVLDTLTSKKGHTLRDKDELREACLCGLAFPRPIWREGPAMQCIPSYKLDSRKADENAKMEPLCARVADDTLMHYDSQRVPAWCDRILWRHVNGNVDVEQKQLSVCTMHGKSDHAPVGAHFVLSQRSVPRFRWTLICPDEIVVTMNSNASDAAFPAAKYLRVRFLGDFIEDDYTSLVKGQKSEHKTVYKWNSKMAFVPQFPTAPPFSRGSGLYATPLRVVLCDGLKQTCGHAVLPFDNGVKTDGSTMNSQPSQLPSISEAIGSYSFTEPLLYRGLIIGEISVRISVE